MLGTLKNSFHVPRYILRILRSYLKDRFLLYETLEAQRMEITSGVAQGSILGPDLWNASHDTLLRLYMPEELRLVSYVDDIAALTAGHPVEQAQSRFGRLMRWVSVLTIESKPTVKYLALILDSKISFFKQIKAAVGRVAVGVAALTRLHLLGDVFFWKQRSRFCFIARRYELIPLTRRCIVSALLKCRDGELDEWRLLIVLSQNR